VQTIRNQVLAVSILAAATAPMTATLVNVMTDSAKLQQVADFSKVDPISDKALVRRALMCLRAVYMMWEEGGGGGSVEGSRVEVMLPGVEA
jgi:hypothetical protein